MREKRTSTEQPVALTAMSKPKMLSRESVTGRALLAIALLVGFYLLALLIVGLLLFIVYVQWKYMPVLNLYISLACVTGAATILWAIIPRFDRFKAPGAPLTAEEQPELFAVIAAVAQQTGQQLPAEVYLTPNVSAFVTQRGGIMGIGSRRIMGLGIGLLQVLNVSQLRAALAHEFGHYYGGDTALSPLVYRTYAAIVRAMDSLGRHDSALQQPFYWYGLMFLRSTHRISRHQEYVADELAARVAGPASLIGCLRAVHAAGPAFDLYWTNEVAPLLRSGKLPPLAAGFSHFVAQDAIALQFEAEVEREIRERQPDPYDTHPTLPERIAAVEHLMVGEATHDNRSAINLLGSIPALERQLVIRISGEREVVRMTLISWEKAGAQGYVPIWKEHLARQGPLLAVVTPQDLLEIAPRLALFSTKLIHPNKESMTPWELVDYAATILGMALSVALYECGWQLRALPGAPVLAQRDGATLQPFDIIHELARSEISADKWQQLCAETGISGIDLGTLHTC